MSTNFDTSGGFAVKSLEFLSLGYHTTCVNSYLRHVFVKY